MKERGKAQGKQEGAFVSIVARDKLELEKQKKNLINFI